MLMLYRLSGLLTLICIPVNNALDIDGTGITSVDFWIKWWWAFTIVALFVSAILLTVLFCCCENYCAHRKFLERKLSRKATLQMQPLTAGNAQAASGGGSGGDYYGYGYGGLEPVTMPPSSPFSNQPYQQMTPVKLATSRRPQSNISNLLDQTLCKSSPNISEIHCEYPDCCFVERIAEIQEEDIEKIKPPTTKPLYIPVEVHSPPMEEKPVKLMTASYPAPLAHRSPRHTRKMANVQDTEQVTYTTVVKTTNRDRVIDYSTTCSEDECYHCTPPQTRQKQRRAHLPQRIDSDHLESYQIQHCEHVTPKSPPPPAPTGVGFSGSHGHLTFLTSISDMDECEIDV